MAIVYLVKSASFNENEVFYKVGYTSNLFKRLIPYMVHNPSIQLIQTAEVYKKTKRNLENEIHNEIKKLVKGLMIESYIEDGCQKIGEHVYGKSITDPCIGWKKTEKLIYNVAETL